MAMIQPLRQRLENERGKLQQVQADIVQSESILTVLQTQALDIEQAALIHRTVAQETQQKLSWYIDDMVTFAIEAIFPDDPARFKLEFVQRRGRTEADLWLADAHGNKIKPQDDDGGGLVDIVSFALRICLWSLTKSSRKTIILDEPLKFLSRNLLSKAGELIKTLSERLGLQIIMISHLDELIDEADRIIEIKKEKGVSCVRH